MTRVALPHHLRTLAQVVGEVDVPGGTLADVLTALETSYPVLAGTMRDRRTLRRRAFVRFFACGADLSHDDPAAPLPDAVLQGREPLLVVGAMAGG